MAINRLHQAGAELQNIYAEFTNVVGYLVVVRISTSTSFYKTGSNSFKISGSGQATQRTSLAKQIPATAQLGIGCHYRIGIRDSVGTVPVPLFGVREIGSSTPLIYVACPVDGYIALYKEGNTLVGSYIPIVVDQWYHYGLDIKKDASDGWVCLYLDGTLVASFSGNTGATQPTEVDFGTFIGTQDRGWSSASTGDTYFDDVIIDDRTGETSSTPIPDQRFNYKGLSADGTYLEFSTYTGSTHYTLLDETPPSGNDYVYSTTPGQRDSYQFSDYTLSSGETIEALIPIAVARKESATDVRLGLGAGLSGTFVLGSYQSLPTSYGQSIYNRMTTNPFGEDWTENDINNAQLYIMSSGTYT